VTTITLYRPVGPKELELIRHSGFRAFPPRLPHQPIFSPVLNREYAVEIARDWNAQDRETGYSGYVTRFEVDAEFLARYRSHRVGDATHQEYWIPALELEAFNAHIVGPIDVIDEYHGAPDGVA
jgi:hypothetical protein